MWWPCFIVIILTQWGQSFNPQPNLRGSAVSRWNSQVTISLSVICPIQTEGERIFSEWTVFNSLCLHLHLKGLFLFPLSSPFPPPMPLVLLPPVIFCIAHSFLSVYLNKMSMDVCGHVALWTQSPGRKPPLTAVCTAAFCQLPLLSKLRPCTVKPANCSWAFFCFRTSQYLGTGY